MGDRGRIADGGGLRGWSAPLAFAFAYWAAATASLAFTRGTDGIATMWPASGVLLAGLLWLPARHGWRCVGLTAAASLLANLTAGTPPGTSLLYTGANMTEAMLAAYLIGRSGPRRLSFIDPRDVARFCLAAAVAAAWSAGVAWLGSSPDLSDWLFPASWFATVMLGVLIVAPAILITLSLADPDARDIVLIHSPAEAVAFLLLVAAVTLAVFTQDRHLLFLPLVVVLATTYRLGPFGAAAGVLIVATVAPVLTDLGYGPLAGAAGLEGVFFLQFYTLAMFATALPLAALLTAQRRLAEQCAGSERMHRLLADSSSDIIARLTTEGLPLYVSPAVAGVLGYRPDEAVGRLFRTVHGDDRAVVADAWTRLLANGSERFVFRQRRRAGGHAWLEAACRLVAAEGGGREVVASVRDVTERYAAERAAEEAGRRMREANRLLGMAERAAQVGHWRIDLTGDTLFWSPELSRIHGWPAGDTPLLAEAIDAYHPDDRDRVAALVKRALASATAFDFEARIIRRDGQVRHVISRGQPEIGYDGRAVALFGVVQDVTRQVLAERELDAALRAAEDAAARAIRMADTDVLTGVASRRKALAVLDEAIGHAESTGEPLAIAIFDIDHFKSVNDRWGHAAGDTVLRRVARAAREAVRPTDLVGRLGGEEFVVILPGLSAANAVALAETLRRAIETSAGEPDSGPPVTASIGISLHPAGGTAAALLGEADRALYRAKASGRNAARLAA